MRDVKCRTYRLEDVFSGLQRYLSQEWIWLGWLEQERQSHVFLNVWTPRIVNFSSNCIVHVFVCGCSSHPWWKVCHGCVSDYDITKRRPSTQISPPATGFRCNCFVAASFSSFCSLQYMSAGPYLSCRLEQKTSKFLNYKSALVSYKTEIFIETSQLVYKLMLIDLLFNAVFKLSFRNQSIKVETEIILKSDWDMMKFV